MIAVRVLAKLHLNRLVKVQLSGTRRKTYLLNVYGVGGQMIDMKDRRGLSEIIGVEWQCTEK